MPGGDLVEDGIADLREGRTTIPAWLVSIGAPRLRLGGLDVPQTLPSPEHGLYERLRQDDPDSAHGRYNALVRRLVSCERALACGG